MSVEIPHKPKIFLCYCEEDFQRANELYDRMQAAGWRPWLDERDILPGEKRKAAIEEAITGADFFIVCLSERVEHRRGRIQKEIRHALDVLQNLLEDDIYLIPVLLESCELPERLKEFQPVRLYRPDGFDNLIRALNAGLRRRLRESNAAHDAIGHPVELQSRDSSARPETETETVSFEFRFYNLLAGAHNGLHTGQPRETATCLQQCTILLLRIVLRASRGEAAAREAPVKELMRHLHDTVKERAILELIRGIIQHCHLVSHDLDEAISRKRSGNLFVEFLAVFFWFQRNILNEQQPNLILLSEALSPRPVASDGPIRLPKEVFLFSEENLPLTASDAESDSSSDSSSNAKSDAGVAARSRAPEKITRIALHQAALDSANDLEGWQKFLANLACFQLRTNVAVPFIEIHKHSEEIELSFVTVCRSVTCVFARLQAAYILIHIGPPIAAGDWCAERQISTNLTDFIEVFAVPAGPRDRPLVRVLQTTSGDAAPLPPELIARTDAGQAHVNLAPEMEQAVHNDIDATTYAEYKAASRAATGFIQSNIALLNDDHDLLQALSYPMDTWRLFLHPLQSRITTHPARFLFIQGGPGTGKTVVLAHRIAHAIQRREASGRDFKIIFLAFTKSVAQNMRRMLDKLNVDPGRILIEDVRGFFARKTRGELGLQYEKRTLTYWEMFRGSKETFRVSDVFFDEFQDFPTHDSNNYIINLIRAVQASGATLTCTYDEHQSIYHTKTDLAFWDDLLKIEHQKLTYCYRMAREISEIAYTHRRIMLAHAEDMIRMSTGKSLPYRVQHEPNYAFGGGSVFLVPSIGIRQIGVAKRIVAELQKTYAQDEIVIIFFDPQHYGRRHSGKLTPGWYENLKKDLSVDIYNPFAIKGLEFRAGVVLFPQYCFMKYYMYLRDGVSLKRLDDFCDVMARYYSEHIKSLSYTHYQVDPSRIDDLSYFLNTAPIIAGRSDSPGIRQLIDDLHEREIAGPLLTELHEMYNRFLSHDLKSLLVRYVNNGRDSSATLDRDAFQHVRESLAANNAKIKKHTRFRRARMIHSEIDHSLRDLNEFYVALTRFREKVFLVYDQEYNLADILPGAKLSHENHLFVS